MLYVSRFFFILFLLFGLLSSRIVLANEQETNTILYRCLDPISGEPYFTNVRSSVPQDCLKLESFPISQYAPKNNNIENNIADSSGLRASEKSQIQNFSSSSEAATHSTTNTESPWLREYYHEQCLTYRTRVEEAQSDRKDDVKLNRQIQRDLKQIDYYCP